MDKPNLVVIAGCNGSGKSTFSSIILNQQFSIFDADKRKKELNDAIFLLEASKSSSVPRLIVDYQKGSGCSINHQLPSYLESYCPDFIKFIYKHI